MAVLITNGDHNISDASAFYRVEAHNLGSHSLYGSNFALSLPQSFTALQFANSGNCQGVGVSINNVNAGAYNNPTTFDRGITASLQETKGTFTVSIATPAIVTLAGHGFVGNEPVMLATTGALPTGLSQNTIYYVKYIDVSTFNLSLNAGGANINTSGSQYGTHTLWAIRASKTKTVSEIMGTETNKIFNVVIPFIFDTPYAVDTSAAKWRFNFIQVGGITGQYFLNSSSYAHSIANLFYFTWCDNALSFSDGDALVVKDYLTINANCTITGVTATGTDYGGATLRYAIIVCSNIANPAPDNVAYLRWASSPAASYTMTLNGKIILNSFSGFRIGTAASPIPFAQRAIIATGAAGYTTGIWSAGATTDSPIWCSTQASLFFYGEVPTTRSALVNANANSGQNKIYTITSTGWASGNRIKIGKYDYQGNVNNSFTISSISGTEITLSGNLTQNVLAGGVIFNLENYGISINDSAARAFYISLSAPANYNISGCLMGYVQIKTGLDFNNFNQYVIEVNLANRSKNNFSDNAINGAYPYGIFYSYVPSLGLDIKRNHTYGCPFGSYLIPFYSTVANSGSIVIDSNIGTNASDNSIWCVSNGMGLGVINGVASIVKNLTISNNKFYNISNPTYWIIGLNGFYNTISGNDFYGITTGVNPAIQLYNVSNTDFLSNTFVKVTEVYKFKSSSTNFLLSFTGDYFASNTADFGFTSTVYFQGVISDSLTALTISSTNLSTCVPGSTLSIVDEGGVSNKDSVYTPFGIFNRCGDGLTDTTAHTVGTNKFSLRFQPTSSTDLFAWEFKVPTGNIQNKEMVLTCWVKINSATYYAGTHRKPRLNIYYDNSTTAYAEATASTSWQLLTVAFTPLTTYGQISVTVDGYTDATSTNAYFYVDNFTVFYPAGVQLELGGLDLWADAFPVTPPIATNITAADVWNVLTSGLVASGSVGKLVVDNIDTTISSRLASSSYTVPPTAESISDAVWDEILTGATHNISSSAGRRLRQVAGSIVIDGTSQGSGVNGNQIILGLDASDVNGAYDPSIIAIVLGTGAGQCRNIIEYAGSTRTATVDRNWKVNPSTDSEYIIFAGAGREHVNEGLARGGTINTITLNTSASDADDAYNNQIIFLRSGLGEDQSRIVLDYDGTSKIATVCRDWDITPNTTTGYVMLPNISHTPEQIKDEVDTSTILAKELTLTDIQTSVNIIKKITKNRIKLNTTTNQLEVYDDNGTSVLYAFDCFDSDGVPSVEEVYDRVPA
jgi:hypothetical protein